MSDRDHVAMFDASFSGWLVVEKNIAFAREIAEEETVLSVDSCACAAATRRR